VAVVVTSTEYRCNAVSAVNLGELSRYLKSRSVGVWTIDGKDWGTIQIEHWNFISNYPPPAIELGFGGSRPG
jgi:hypothetical protein